jgi:hypothetical protein
VVNLAYVFMAFGLLSMSLSVLIMNLGIRRKAKAESVVPTVPTCPCGHTIGEHKDQLACLGQTRRPFYYSNGSRNGYEWVQCSCTKYYGPKPITDFFHSGVHFPVDEPVDD